MRQRSDLRRLRVLVIVLGIALLSFHWSIREDGCGPGSTLEITVANGTPATADVLVAVVDSTNQTVFEGEYHLAPGEEIQTGPIGLTPGLYRAEATVRGEGSQSGAVRVDACRGEARIEVRQDSITIVRSQDR